jgi:hypothetical protein
MHCLVALRSTCCFALLCRVLRYVQMLLSFLFLACPSSSETPPMSSFPCPNAACTTCALSDGNPAHVHPFFPLSIPPPWRGKCHITKHRHPPPIRTPSLPPLAILASSSSTTSCGLIVIWTICGLGPGAKRASTILAPLMDEELKRA